MNRPDAALLAAQQAQHIRQMQQQQIKDQQWRERMALVAKLHADKKLKRKHDKLQRAGEGSTAVPGGAASSVHANEEEDVDGFGDGVEEESFAAVSTADLEALGLTRHPDAIAECLSMSSVVAPKASYKSRLPAHVLFGEIGELYYGLSLTLILA